MPTRRSIRKKTRQADLAKKTAKETQKEFDQLQYTILKETSTDGTINIKDTPEYKRDLKNQEWRAQNQEVLANLIALYFTSGTVQGLTAGSTTFTRVATQYGDKVAKIYKKIADVFGPIAPGPRVGKAVEQATKPIVEQFKGYMASKAGKEETARYAYDFVKKYVMGDKTITDSILAVGGLSFGDDIHPYLMENFPSYNKIVTEAGSVQEEVQRRVKGEEQIKTDNDGKSKGVRTEKLSRDIHQEGNSQGQSR